MSNEFTNDPLTLAVQTLGFALQSVNVLLQYGTSPDHPLNGKDLREIVAGEVNKLCKLEDPIDLASNWLEEYTAGMSYTLRDELMAQIGIVHAAWCAASIKYGGPVYVAKGDV